MHKLAKGLKKKKKQKKGKKGAEEDEFDPEELERYRRERAEAQQKAEDSGEQASNASSDEWKKFEALTAGVDSILKKTQGDLDRIKSTSFFQRKPPLDEERRKEGEEGEEAEKEEDHKKKKKSSSSKKWVGFDEEGNPIEGEPPDFVDVPDDEDGHEDSADEDIFDTTYVDVLQNIDVQLAYIPDSPVEEETGDDPFDTTNADKVLKTVDKKGNKLVSLGNAVEVLSGRIDYVSSCKISRGRRPRLQQDLLDYLPGEEEQEEEAADVDPFDTSFVAKVAPGKTELKLIESELLRQQDHSPSTRLPHSLSDHEFDPRAEGEPVRRQSDFTIRPNDLRINELQNSVLRKFEEVNKRGELVEKRQESLLDERIEVDAKPLTPRIETRTIEEDEEISYQDPFDTSIATNILPGKAELKILETELEQIPAEIPIARPVPIALTAVINTTVIPEVDPDFDPRAEERKDFLCIDDQDPGAKVLTPLQNESFPLGEDVDPFDTSFASLGPGKTELKLLEPPPPRPQPPAPPKNTKDLILSVTGAMDATSNHLLDRLQATRTPSPTLMHSPSPTPEHSFADFLDVDSNVPDLMSDDNSKAVEPPKNRDILDLFDAPNTDTTTTTIFSSSTIAEDSSGTGVTLISATTQDNPFVSITEQQPSPVQQADEFQETVSVASEKRPSVSSTTGAVGSDTERVDMDLAGETLRSSSTGNELFSTTEQLSTSVTESTFFSVADTVIAPFSTPMQMSAAQSLFTTSEISLPSSGPFASDLLGDFGEPTNTGGARSTSPIPGAEFPTSEAYKPEEQLDNLAATTQQKTAESGGDAFDIFASKFDKAAEQETNAGDPFLDAFGGGPTAMDTSSDVWGDSSATGSETAVTGFGESDGFDSFLSMTAPPPELTVKRTESVDSDAGPDFSVFIKPKEGDQSGIEGGAVPVLAPPPKSPQNTAYVDTSPRFNPFDKSGSAQDAIPTTETVQPEITRTDSQETPPTPLFDEDVSQPLEDFPRVTYTGDGWDMHLRQPNKKKITGQRFWKKIFVKLVYQGDNPVLQLFNSREDKDPFQELPLVPSYSVSDIGAQQFDQYGKIFTVKLQYIFYKERPGVRPGQVTKAERLTNKLSQFAAYAIQGDYQGVKEFGSDLKKLGLPVEHAPQISELFKLGSQCYEDMKQFSCAIEEALFRLPAHRDRALNYKTEDVQITVVDELYVEQNAQGQVEKQIARVRLFFLGFLSGMPDVELGINDMWRQGKEVVGRHDIIPVVTEEWIRLENVEFHSCVQQDEYEKSRIIKFKPPDACYIELMRFRVRPPKNRELPLQLKAVMCITGNKVELRADILVPGFASRKLGQVPCEDVMVRFPIPECWIYLFRVEKHFRYGSVKSAHRRTGKIKGIERFLGAVDNLEPQLMEVTSGQAKYEHQHRAIVWRMPRLPKEGQGAYTTHQLICRMALTSYDQIPENLAEYCYVEFTMPATQVSHTTARSVSFQNHDSDNPPEKYVKNLSRHEYRVGIEHTQGEGPGAYVSATYTRKIPETTPETQGEASDAGAESDSDSSD
ncbi:protein stoned-B-like [Apis dorsata]|uniref:protein stoned-B-like n=1 Tax=Apis dorsata TaxID=7462 RepID=UPI0003DF7FCD|nr:protein stoned-B-like [Apis dorsata]